MSEFFTSLTRTKKSPQTTAYSKCVGDCWPGRPARVGRRRREEDGGDFEIVTGSGRHPAGCQRKPRRRAVLQVVRKEHNHAGICTRISEAARRQSNAGY